ncbi:MAG: hypothetical protein ACJ73Z_05405, partial [Rubrobacteraceae bacterium]
RRSSATSRRGRTRLLKYFGEARLHAAADEGANGGPGVPAPHPATVDAPATSCVASPTPSSTAGRVFSFPPAALAKALLRVVGDPKLTARMGQDGRERAARLFSWESIARDHLALFGV